MRRIIMLSLLMETTIKELTQTGVSNKTWDFLDNRLRYGDSGVTVESSFYNVGEGYYEAWFKANSTTSDAKYDIVFRWYDVDKYFTDDPKKVRYSEVEKMLRNVIYKCNVRLYSSDPSFSMQGCWEGLDANDLSIYKFPGPKGAGIWNTRHMASGGLTNKNIHLTKHLAQIASNIETYVPKLAQKLDVAFEQEKK